MDIEGHALLPFPRQAVWAHLHDPAVLRRAVPGCESMHAVSPEKFVARVSASVGPIKARFEGDAVISEAEPPESFTLTASGKGGVAGFASAVVKIRLQDDVGETRLDYTLEAKLGGKLAQLGARLIESTARSFAEAFFARFSAAMAAPATIAVNEAKPTPVRRRRISILARLRSFMEARKKVRAASRQAQVAVCTPDPMPAAQPTHVPASGYIDIEIGNDIAEVRLNRPEKKNCVSFAMWLEIAQAFNDLGGNDEVRCIVLTGAGGHFSSGADKSEFGEVRSTPEQVATYEQAVSGASEAILDCPKPVVAAIEGYCVGGGLGLAMACDFRVGKAGSEYFIPAAKLGVVYGERATHSLLALVGLVNAKRILFAGHRMDADEAKSMGLVDEVFSEDAYDDGLAEFLGKLTDGSPRTISGSKAILHSITGLTPPDEARTL
ncbi:MAG: enoyl-CoA hydratase-related protein [Gammaproteobacteria bacterium]|nr:enoyl-CoA hydratase-related protein [Gammaproteobacteria bacterium]